MNVIFGASGHAREIAFIIRSTGSKLDFFVTNHSANQYVNEVPVITENTFFQLQFDEQVDINAFVAIGDSNIRKTVVNKIRDEVKGVKFPNLFHHSVIKDDLENVIEMGEGNIFFPGTILTTNIKVGNHNHFNSNTSISHDCEIGNYNTFSPRTTIAGKVKLGNFNFFGTGAVVINNLCLADNLIVGAGSVIVNNISEKGTYLGVPAKRKK